jgi:hypothetical protein
MVFEGRLGKIKLIGVLCRAKTTASKRCQSALFLSFPELERQRTERRGGICCGATWQVDLAVAGHDCAVCWSQIYWTQEVSKAIRTGGAQGLKKYEPRREVHGAAERSREPGENTLCKTRPFATGM